ncbi:MAG: SpoIVB peptidase [Clostridia bacterium]|nr:SpoIVB peptidase [Clostridia bacterium]
MKSKKGVLAAYVLAAAGLLFAIGGERLPVFFFGANAAQAGLFPAEQEMKAPRMLIPGGQAVGVALRTQGVMVIDVPRDGIALRPGDVIVAVNGAAVSSAQALGVCIAQQDGSTASLSLMRGEKAMEVDVPVMQDEADGKRRLGVWVRDSTAGVGTLTYIDPQTGAYGALGHAIVDADTGRLMEAAQGAVMEADVVAVVRGERGKAGELRGSFLKENRQIGTLEKNSRQGIFGTMSAGVEGALYPQGLPAADARQVHTGAATILSTVDGTMQEYTIEITRFLPQNMRGTKDMSLRVTDERLLAVTGGIVQGMSGSPILQDGRIVGAVTHVLVDDPTRGYGIFIENMLEAAG